MEPSRELEVAQEAARVGGAIVARYFRDGVAMRSKESYNLVSDADIDSERAIVETIRAAFPDDAILAEELHAASTVANRIWIIDPLDGTNNFAHGIPQFAVSIAFCEDGHARAGAIYNPAREEWGIAALGEGAFWNGERVQTSRHERLDQSLIGVGFYYDRGAMMEATLWALRDLFRRNVHGIRRFGAAALDLCMVGMGMLDAFFEYQLSPWDFAAGALFVAEAGGKVTTCAGDPPPVARTSLLASNGLVHDAVLEVVREHDPNAR
jgi:myo-inositol-1(or 4)-monophosphatase